VIPHLIELKDPGISVRTAGELLAQSPGFANIANKLPVFGEDARQMARLHPRQTFNQFWSQLSLDPLALKNNFFRHSADLAHSHLDQLTKSMVFEHGAIIAAPSNYNRAQLAVLLGIVKQCAFDAVGLVDLALLQASSTDADSCIIIDLQLHQCVLTSFRKIDGQLVRDRMIQVPASGLLALQDAWSNMITDEFIRQCRFDPHHNAETEQYVYNQLPQWIEQSQRQNELLVEINHRGTVYQAHLTRAQFDQRSRTILARIGKELEPLRTPDTALHTTASHMGLPGVTLHLPGLIALDDDSTMVACIRHLDDIRRPADNLHFITRLSLHTPSQATAHTMIPALQNRLPTHVLFRHKALPLPTGRLVFGTPPAGLDAARIVPLPELTAGRAVALVRTARELLLEVYGPVPVLLDGNPVQHGQNVTLGNLLQLGPNGPALQLIMVE
jgi:hypothetical protein